MRARRALIVVFAVVALVAPAQARTLPATGDALAAGAYRAVPLAAPVPDWYTPQLHAQVLAAGAEGVPLPPQADPKLSALAFTGIRPGSWMLFPAGCTMNFVFGSLPSSTTTKASGPKQGGKPSRGGGLGIGTAGHCTEVGDDVVLVMAPGVLVNIGKTSKSVDKGVGNDFALVDIKPELYDIVNPSMAILAGPTATGAPKFGQAVAHVGHGLGIGTGGTPRAGVVTYVGKGETQDATAAFGWTGAGIWGDSGSGVRAASGEAVGNLTHLVILVKPSEYAPAIIGGTTASAMERIAGKPIACASLVPNPLPQPLPVPCT